MIHNANENFNSKTFGVANLLDDGLRHCLVLGILLHDLNKRQS